MGHIIALNNNRLPSVKKKTHTEWNDSYQHLAKKLRQYLSYVYKLGGSKERPWTHLLQLWGDMQAV